MRRSSLLPRLSIFFLVFSLFHTGTALAQELPTQKLSPQNITVFLKGAELLSTTSLNLPAGETDILFTNVAGNINEQSLSISATNGVLIQSYQISNDFLTDENLSPQAKIIKQKLEDTQAEKERLQIQISIIKEQLAVLAENRKLGSEKSAASATEVARMLDLVDKKMGAALNHQAKTNAALKKTEEKLAKLEHQLAEEKGKDYQPGGQILVKFFSAKPVTSKITVSYLSPEAGWMPSYDLRIPKPGAPVNLIYKAKVFQNTGIRWDNVQLNLSTGNPSQGAQAPTLSPWYVRAYEEEIMLARPSAARAMVAPAPASPILGKAIAAKQAPQQTLDGYVTTQTDGINVVFNIAIPYSIPSDGKGHIVMIKSADLPGIYYTAATPKLDQDAFLMVELKPQASLNLLPGQTNIFFQDSFVGQGQIRKFDGKTGLYLSLGRDKQVQVYRKSDLDYTDKPVFFGNTVEKKYAYTITVKNDRKEAIKLVVNDQVPVSQSNDVKVESLQYGNAEYNAQDGSLKWTLDLAPNESKTFPFSYTVSYPKDKTVSGL